MDSPALLIFATERIKVNLSTNNFEARPFLPLNLEKKRIFDKLGLRGIDMLYRPQTQSIHSEVAFLTL